MLIERYDANKGSWTKEWDGYLEKRVHGDGEGNCEASREQSACERGSSSTRTPSCASNPGWIEFRDKPSGGAKVTTPPQKQQE